MDVVTVVAWVLRVIVAIIFLGMGINHFLPRGSRAMARIVPPRIRRDGILKPINLVYFTGVCEVLGGIGILLPPTRLTAAIALTVFLVAVFPANVYASQHPELFGRMAIPFWPRLVGQLAIIALVLVAGMLG
jgi:uncharacterized membrane protein